jgi:replicative DNA helicase
VNHPPNGNGRANGHSHQEPIDFMRLPPHNLEAERGAIGSMLLDNATIDDVLEHCKPADFYRDSHQVLVGAIAWLHGRGEPADPITLADRLTALDKFEDIGGHPAIVEILESTPHAVNAGYYARVVRQKAIVRALIDAANETLLECYSGGFAADDLAEAAERRFFAVTDAEAASETIGLAECVALASAAIRRRSLGEVDGVGSGLPDLDDLTGGFRPGSLTILAARPSAGKSALALNICEHAALSQKIHPLLFSLEMGRAELGERLIQSRSRIDGHKLRAADLLSREEWVRVEWVERELSAATFLIDDSAQRNPAQLSAIARRAKSRHGIGLIVIDYLQLLESGDGPDRESRQEQVARISRRLKGIARELDVPVIALSQLNRLVEQREDHRPRLSDLRDSGAIEADADLVILLHRPDYYDPTDRPGLAEAIVAKNRNGPTDTVPLVFLKHLARFESAAPDVDFGAASPNEPVF